MGVIAFVVVTANRGILIVTRKWTQNQRSRQSKTHNQGPDLEVEEKPRKEVQN